jgi:hypothetical protein
LQLADAALQSGRPDEGLLIKSKLIEQFSRYTDLADIFGSVPPSNGAPAPNTVPGPPPESSPGEKGVTPKQPAPDQSAAAGLAHDPPAHSAGDTDHPNGPLHQN